MALNADSSNVNRRRFLVVSGAAAASSLALGSSLGSTQALATAPVDPLVTIDITKSPISYTVSGNNAYRLAVKGGDTVNWKATTTGPKHHLAILFVKETPFSLNKQPVYAFHGSEIDEAGAGIGGSIDANASGTYEYYVAVFDSATNLTYTDDPKIMVGSGNLTVDAELKELILLHSELEDVAARSDPTLRKKIESIDEKLEKLIDKLK